MSSVGAFLAVPSDRAPAASPAADRVAYVRAGPGDATLRVSDSDGDARRELGVSIPDEPAHALVSWGPGGDVLVVRAGEGSLDEATVDLLPLDDPDGRRRTLVDRPGQSVPLDVGAEVVYYLQADADAAGDSGGWTLRRVRRDGSGDEAVFEYPRLAVLVDAGRSPDGDRLAVTVADPDDPTESVVHLLDPDGGHRRTLDLRDAGDGRAYASAWGPAGRRLLVTAGVGGGRVGVYDLATDALAWRTDVDVEERGVTFLPDGGVLVERKAERRRRLVVYRDGTERVLDVPGTVRIPPGRTTDALTDDGVVCLRTTPTRPWEAVQVPFDGAPTVLQPVELGDAPSRAAREPDRVSYPVGDGETVEGLLYDPGVRPAPAVATVYGARTKPSPWFSPERGLLLDRGYAVFVPTTRRDTYHGLADFVAGLDWLADREWIDGDRIAAYGHSHGGYDALTLATRHPERVAAAVAHNAPTDLPALAEAGEAVPNMHAELGPYDEHADRWRERSPVTHVDGLGVPTLHLQGTDDWIVPPSQGRRFRDAVRERAPPDADYEYVELSGGHASTDPSKRAAVWERTLAFLDARC